MNHVLVCEGNCIGRFEFASQIFVKFCGKQKSEKKQFCNEYEIFRFMTEKVSWSRQSDA